VERNGRDWQAIRTALRALGRGEVLGIFPQGGIDEFRNENGHLGIGYLALKSGVPVVPVSIGWEKRPPLNLLRSLFTTNKVSVCYGTPLAFPSVTRPTREEITIATSAIMNAIHSLDPSQHH
jgi:1-acyl-sn-glycerol-3-phosphate acyltransferase